MIFDEQKHDEDMRRYREAFFKAYVEPAMIKADKLWDEIEAKHGSKVVTPLKRRWWEIFK